jgi:hypothetical protein
MKADIVIIGAVAAILGVLFMNNNSVTSGFAEAVTPQVPPSVIQVIIEALQKQEPWLQPVETIYITPKTGAQSGITYDVRMLFLDTRGFFGVQYDVTAGVSPAGGVQILSKTTSSSPDRNGPFQSFAPDKYQSYEDINRDLNEQLTSALAASRQLPGKEVQF